MSYPQDYDPYTGRSLSRRPSMNYAAGSSYAHSTFHGVPGVAMSEVSFPSSYLQTVLTVQLSPRTLRTLRQVATVLSSP